MPPTSSSSEDVLKRPAKRLCTSSSSSSLTTSTQTQPTTPTPAINIPSILHLPTDAVWSLRKSELRIYFLALQEYVLNPSPLTPPTQPATPIPSPSQQLQPQLPPLDRTQTQTQKQTQTQTQTQRPTPTPTQAPIQPPPPAAPPPPPFLLLPIEIRELIYIHLLSPLPTTSTTTTTPCHRGPHPRQLQTNLTLSQSFPSSILLLNKQIRLEALPILWGSQTIGITIDYNLWLHKKRRSELILSPAVTSCIRHIHLSIHLGSEKRNTKPGAVEADARLTEVKKGVRKLAKWLGGADIRSLRVSWQEPPQTFTWEQKRGVLDEVRVLRAVMVDAGEINWGLEWNKGRRYRFEIEYLKELERGPPEEDMGGGGGGADLEMVVSRRDQCMTGYGLQIELAN